LKAKEVAKPVPVVPLGTIGKREQFVLTFVKRVGYDNDFGGGIMCAFESAEGHQVVWFTSGACPRSDDLNKPMVVTGTVKKHGERNGRPQTTLSRCKFELVETSKAVAG
jgi:hypothetical protein